MNSIMANEKQILKCPEPGCGVEFEFEQESMLFASKGLGDLFKKKKENEPPQKEWVTLECPNGHSHRYKVTIY